MSLKRRRIESKEELLTLIFELLDENDALEWKNETVYQYLQGMAAWLNDADEFYRRVGEGTDSERASWQLFADMLQAARSCE